MTNIKINSRNVTFSHSGKEYKKRYIIRKGIPVICWQPELNDGLRLNREEQEALKTLIKTKQGELNMLEEPIGITDVVMESTTPALKGRCLRSQAHVD